MRGSVWPLARAVEGHPIRFRKPPSLYWKYLTDVVEKRQEEDARIFHLHELQNCDKVLDIVQHQHSASSDESSPDLGGETLLENFLIHHPTLSEPLDRQEVKHGQEVLVKIGAAPVLHYCVHLVKQKTAPTRRY